MANVCIPPSHVAEMKAQLASGEIGAEEISKMLPDERQALKSLLEDFITDKLNVSATADEVRVISQKSKKIDEAYKNLGDGLGSPDKVKENLDFFKAKKEMDDFLQSHNPAPKLRVLTGTIGRGMMLASVKSPVLNIGSNIEVGLTEGIGRRIASHKLRGTDNKLARDYIKMVNKVYQKTGYDLSRMTQLSDTGAGGARVLDDIVHAQGKGATRKTGRVVEDVVFKQLMGAPDVASGSIHFADSVNLNALRFAKGDKAKAKELMQDAMRIEPLTDDGKLLRDQGILDAQVATWTNKTWASRVSMGIRKILNDLSGDLRAGDYLLPFVKTPANVVATGMDYAGAGIPKSLLRTIKAIRSGELKDREFIQQTSRDLVRSGLGITGAVIIANALKPEDFVGAYDPARAQIEALKNSRENSVRIGGKWISTDWFGPLAVPLNGIMYARKYGKSPGESGYQYTKGVASTGLNIPGIKDVADFTAKQKQKKDQTLEEATGGASNYVTDQASSRLIPSILSDVAKATDSKERQSTKGLEGVKGKLPVLRKTLPEKRTVFGESVKAEPGLQTILFGSRVKSDRETKLIKEIDRVSKAADKSVNFTDWDKSNNKNLAQFKSKVGQAKYDEARSKYGRDLQTRLKSIIADPKYQKASDEDRLNQINGADAKSITKIFNQYNFKYKKVAKKNY